MTGMVRCLILVLEGPMAAYGAEMVDARGPVRDWPGASMLTGLLANALGYNRCEGVRLSSLQDRLDFAVRVDRRGTLIRDFQTAKLEGSDKGWTTHGKPEERAGGAGTYHSPHIRERDYFADSAVTVALTLHDTIAAPTLDDLAVALLNPARPLFLGRKPCLPTRPILDGVVDAVSVIDALYKVTLTEPADQDIALIVLDQPGLSASAATLHVTDQRNWIGGVHGGERIFRRLRWLRPQQIEEATP